VAGSKNLVVQPKFAEQLQNLPSPLGVQLPVKRGYMIWSDTGGNLGYAGGPLSDGRDVINFLYNPSTVTTDYNVGNASLQAAMMYTVPGDNGNLLSPLLQQTVSWQLFFDRTFELNYGTNSSAINDPAVIGVQADIYQFMQFTGVLATLGLQQAQQVQSAGVSGTSLGSANDDTAQAATTGGIMMMIPCWVYFGDAFQQMNQNASNTNFNAIGSQMAFYGYISEWTVNYTHFTVNMVPIRASVTVTFTMLPNPTAGSKTAVWRDIQKLDGTYTTSPLVAGYTPPPSLINTGG
jgi:hypothetical protein